MDWVPVGIFILVVLAIIFLLILLIFVLNPRLLIRLRYAIKFLFFEEYRRGFSNGWKFIRTNEEIGHNVWKLLNDYKALYAPYRNENGSFVLELFKMLTTFLSYLMVRVFLLIIWLIIPVIFISFIVALPFSFVIVLAYSLLALILLTLAYFLIESSFSSDIFDELKVGNPISPYRVIVSSIRSFFYSIRSVWFEGYKRLVDHARRITR